MRKLIYSSEYFISLQKSIHDILSLNDTLLHSTYSILNYIMGDLKKAKVLSREEIEENIITPYSQIIIKGEILWKHAYSVIETCQSLSSTNGDECAKQLKKHLDCCVNACNIMRENLGKRTEKLAVLNNIIRQQGAFGLPVASIELWLSNNLPLNTDVKMFEMVYASFHDLAQEINAIAMEYAKFADLLHL